MSRDFSRITILRVSRKNSLKQRPSNKQNTVQHLKTSQSNIVDRPRLKSGRKVIINSKQKIINREGQVNPIFAQAKKEIKQSNLLDCPRDSLPINSITNSTTCFDLSITHRSFNYNRRISPINCRDLFQDDFTFDINERNRKRKKNKKKTNLPLCKIGLCVLVSLLIIGGLIGVLIYVLNQLKSPQTTTTSSVITTTKNSACTTGGNTCPTPMFVRNRTDNCTKPAASYLYYTCCYQAVSTHLTIEFILREDVSNWYIDDVSIKQGNGELLINGGFELNLTGWTVTSSIANLSVTPVAVYSPGAAHASSTYLYSEAKYASDHIKQTVNVIQGQSVNVSFWWLDEGGTPGPTELCEATVTLTP